MRRSRRFMGAPGRGYKEGDEAGMVDGTSGHLPCQAQGSKTLYGCHDEAVVELLFG